MIKPVIRYRFRNGRKTIAALPALARSRVAPVRRGVEGMNSHSERCPEQVSLEGADADGDLDALTAGASKVQAIFEKVT